MNDIRKSFIWLCGCVALCAFLTALQFQIFRNRIVELERRVKAEEAHTLSLMASVGDLLEESSERMQQKLKSKRQVVEK